MLSQFGYLSLFAPAYPLAPLLALINNIFEIRIDAVKFCTVLQRPRYRQSEDIGSWCATRLYPLLPPPPPPPAATTAAAAAAVAVPAALCAYNYVRTRGAFRCIAR